MSESSVRKKLCDAIAAVLRECGWGNAGIGTVITMDRDSYGNGLLSVEAHYKPGSCKD